MSDKPNNPPAFPMPDFIHPDGRVEHGMHGMTLRDYFAAKALSIVSRPAVDGSICQNNGVLACWAYQLADAMLAERAKGQP